MAKKWPKKVKTGHKMTKKKEDQKWRKWSKNDQKWPKMTKSAKTRPKNVSSRLQPGPPTPIDFRHNISREHIG